jgi:hypothetical protein
MIRFRCILRRGVRDLWYVEFYFYFCHNLELGPSVPKRTITIEIPY